MSMFVFQITIKQWDKGHNTPLDQRARNAMPVIFSIAKGPVLSVFNTPCIIDQHGDDLVTNVFSQGRIRASALSADRVMFDRFRIVNEATGPVLEYLPNAFNVKDEESPKVLGQLNEGWIQARYTWRYRVLEDNQIYWMYEEVTLNAIYKKEFDVDCFFKTAPSIVFDNL